jgi:hypothetical protein
VFAGEGDTAEFPPPPRMRGVLCAAAQRKTLQDTATAALQPPFKSCTLSRTETGHCYPLLALVLPSSTILETLWLRFLFSKHFQAMDSRMGGEVFDASGPGSQSLRHSAVGRR